MKKPDIHILEEISNTRGYAYNTIKNYRSVMRSYTSFHNMTMKELIKEADKEEENGVRWKNSKLKKRLLDYRSFLLDKHLLSTVRSHMRRVVSIYRFYDINVQPLPYVGSAQAKVNPPLTYTDIPSREVISKVLGVTNPLLTSIVLFISSSGTGRAETLNITIGDFIESVQEYTYETDIYKVLSALHSRNDIIPMFKLKRQKTNQYYYTFCSPEATKAIMDYLITRKDILTPNKRLFKIDKKYLSDLLRNINDQLGLGERGGFRVLRCHMLRKYHATQLSNEENSLTETDIDFLQGRSDTKTRQSYFFTDEKKLKRRYAESMNAVTIYHQYNVLVDSNNDLFIEVYDPHDEIVPLQEKVVQLGKENSLLRSENKEIRASVKAEARKVFMELLRENNIEL